MAQFVTAEPFSKGNLPKPSGDRMLAWARELWSALSDALGQIQRAQARAKSLTVTVAYTVQVTDRTILADATAAPFTVTLPTATSMLDSQFTIKRKNGGGNAVTIGGTVDGTVNPTLGAQYASITVEAIGTPASAAWFKVASV